MKKCENCSKNFIPKRITAKYCSTSCKVRAYEKRKGISQPDFMNNTQENKLEKLKTEKNKIEKEIKTLAKKYNNLIDEYNNKLESLKPTHRESTKVIEKSTNLSQLVIGLGLSYLEKETEKLRKQSLRNHLKTKENLTITTEKILSEIGSLRVKLKDISIGISKLELNAVRKAEIKQIERKVFDVKEILNQNFNSFNFDGKYQVLGNPESNFKMQIWGTKGQGKSYFTVKFADYLTRFGKVFYNTSEEGISLSFQNKIRSIENTNKIKIGIHKDYKSLKKDIRKGGFQFLILDSLTDMNMTIEDLTEITALNPEISIIYITQATKDGRSKGDEKLGHFADIVIKINNREIEVEKTRYI